VYTWQHSANRIIEHVKPREESERLKACEIPLERNSVCSAKLLSATCRSYLIFVSVDEANGTHILERVSMRLRLFLERWWPCSPGDPSDKSFLIGLQVMCKDFFPTQGSLQVVLIALATPCGCFPMLLSLGIGLNLHLYLSCFQDIARQPGLFVVLPCVCYWEHFCATYDTSAIDRIVARLIRGSATKDCVQ